MPTTFQLRRFARTVLSALWLTVPGCVTCAMWDKLDDTPGERTAAVVLTPATVAIDAALIAGLVYVEVCGGHCGYEGCCGARDCGGCCR